MYFFLALAILSQAFSYQDTPIPGIKNGITKLELSALSLNKTGGKPVQNADRKVLLYQSFRGGDFVDLDFNEEVLGHEFYPTYSVCNVIYEFSNNENTAKYSMGVHNLLSSPESHLPFLVKYSSHIPSKEDGPNTALLFTNSRALIELVSTQEEPLLSAQIGKLSIECMLGLSRHFKEITLQDIISDLGEERIKVIQ